MSESTAAYQWLRKILKDAGYDPDLAIEDASGEYGPGVFTYKTGADCPTGEEARRFIDEAHAQVVAEEAQPEPTLEWCVMHPSHPGEMHRGPMSEKAAREWVANTVTPGSNRTPMFIVAHREVGPWKVDGDTFSLVQPDATTILTALQEVYGDGDMVTSLATHLAESWLVFRVDAQWERRSVEDSVWRTIWDWFPGGDTAQVAAKAVVEAVESDG